MKLVRDLQLGDQMLSSPQDPLDFDSKCDGALPLETMLAPDPAVRQLLLDIDRNKAQVWGMTNAYQTVRSSLALLFIGDSSDFSMQSVFFVF